MRQNLLFKHARSVTGTWVFIGAGDFCGVKKTSILGFLGATGDSSELTRIQSVAWM
jgi:hypothetical protein